MEVHSEIVLETETGELTEAHRRSLPYSFAKRHGVLIRSVDEHEADAVYRSGVSPMSLAEARRFAGIPLKLSRVSTEVFDTMLQDFYDQDRTKASQMVDGLDEEFNLTQVTQELQGPSDLLESDDDAPIIRFINAVLTEAIKENASDIHIEPYENRLGVRFRVDGVLKEILQTRRALAPLVVSRIKVMSKLDIAEKRLPQDGRISLRIAGRAVDVRVSTMPSGHGERVVLRLLDKQAGRLELTSLGMDMDTQKTMDRLIHKPHGIILVTGPTGSGKTTTLYAALERINDNTRNIMTVEDPIEYFIDGIGQSQVNTKVEMTFARGLRAILRQDPDVVMVGEIRDLETAEIAVQASLTGPPCALDLAYQYSSRCRHAPARHGRGAIPVVIEPAWRFGATSCARTGREFQDSLHRARIRMQFVGRRSGQPADFVSPGRRGEWRIFRPHRHLRTDQR